jgi:tocopherol cyclase
MDKNAYRLTRKTKKNGYDWWWHSFVGKHETTGETRPFFIEYYVINPGLWNGEIVLGQSKENKLQKRPPVYAMLKAGSWGKEKVQLHNFYGIDRFQASAKELDCKIGLAVIREDYLKGSVAVTKEEAENNPGMMSDYGTMSWELKAKKLIKYDVGYGSSNLFNRLNAFRMYWHVGGMLTEFDGEVFFNGERYIVSPQTSYGYQDKNWGVDYTNPWIWLNCNNFTSVKNNQPVNASLDLGGGCPTVFGIPLQRKILTAFYYEGKFYEFNFSKFWIYSKQQFSSHEDKEYIYWDIISKNKKVILEIHFKCRKDYLLNVNYENPAGEKNHNKLWNGGHAEGTITISKNNKQKTLIDELHGSFGGCEYGEYTI